MIFKRININAAFLKNNRQKRRTVLRKRAVFLVIFFLPLISLSANSFTDNFYWSFSGNLLYFPANNGVDSDPEPILPSAGFSAAWQFWGPPRFHFRLEITEDIYFKNYEYNVKLGYPMASNPENRSAFVLGFLTGLQLTGVIPFGQSNAAMRVFFGPAFDLRVVALAVDLHPNDLKGDIDVNARLQTDAIKKYFWSSGRWFMPAAGLGIDFPINDNFLLGLDFRAWFPVYKYWTDDKTSNIDGWRFGAGFRVTPRKKS
ncbi:MAG: hypothetical protein FWC21_05625 [Treponema sp.]|nr:hypothetical protein [Treponema sp.]